MGFADKYIKKRVEHKPFITNSVPNDLDVIITIPCYHEPDIISSLESIDACMPHRGRAEVIIVINSSENTPNEIVEYNRQTYREIKDWICSNDNQRIAYYVVNKENLPAKYAGVGLARKIAMDEALIRFNKIGKADGIITGYDADTLCESNYISELQCNFKSSNIKGASIYFEHPTEGREFAPSVYEASAFYELYLRYYKNALRYCGHPYAYHCIGSAYAVRARYYAEQGGMNKKQAGEDFYFLQKIIALGGFTEINSTMLVPSSRISDRTPFGTGRSIEEINRKEKADLLSYDLRAFEHLKVLFDRAEEFYTCDDRVYQDIIGCCDSSISDYCNSISMREGIANINGNCSSKRVFISKFFHFFNVLKVLQYLNYVHTGLYERTSVLEQSLILLKKLQIEYDGGNDVFSVLRFIRNLERNDIIAIRKLK